MHYVYTGRSKSHWTLKPPKYNGTFCQIVYIHNLSSLNDKQEFFMIFFSCREKAIFVNNISAKDHQSQHSATRTTRIRYCFI